MDVTQLHYKEINEALRQSGEDVTISGCLGQRFIAAGMSDKRITVHGVPGNALGAYLNGAEITVCGNAQDAVGDTMNEGKIVVHGDIGDAVGYAMRGGSIFVKGNAGYRAGIHMKEYSGKVPAIVIGGKCGSFLGEYQAGGVIVVLGLGCAGRIVSNFPCTGMHGGRMFLRSDCAGIAFPPNVKVSRATETDLSELDAYITEYCSLFGADKKVVLDAPFTKIVPDSKNPYKQMYVAN